MSEKIGVISDTHGTLRREAVDALHGVDMIIHAGDSGGPAILEALARVAPVHAVRGNCDFGTWAMSLPPDLAVETSGGIFFVLHDIYRLESDPGAAGLTAVIHGHTHMPSISYRDDVLYLNPGSAGPVRRDRPVSLGLIEISGDRDIYPEIIILQDKMGNIF